MENNKVNNEKKVVVLYDSREDFPYEDYVEFCEMNDIEPAGENSQDYWDWVSQTRSDYYDDLMSNLSWTKIDSPVMITGSLGLWDGKHEIHPVVMKSEGYGRKFSTCDYTGYDIPSLKAAIKKCCEGRDTLDVEVKFEEDRIVVYAHHHDGCNIFDIRRLSEKGLKLADEAVENGEVCCPEEDWFSPINFDEIDF